MKNFAYLLKLACEYSTGLLKRVKNSTTVFWEAVSSDAFGHIQLENFGNGVATFTEFDQASGLMEKREGGLGGGTGLIHAEVNWDLNGNLTRRKDLKLSPAITEDFTYDSLNRFDYSQRTVGTGTPATNADVTLDAIGNISWKLGVGSYGYHAIQKRAVITAGSNSFGYDANGNMTSRNGSAIGYTSYNLPNVINAPGGYSSTLSYGAFRNRFKQVAVGSAGTETTIYVAGLLEKVTRSGSTEYRHTIHGGQGTAAIYTRESSGTNTTYYLHRDHLGSPEVITDSSGTVLIRPSFAAYGERRDGSDWDGLPSAPDLTTIANISRRGFTGHEHLDAVNLIHMNGRVYEPIAGRFLGVDPIVQLGHSQSPNSYSYVRNNPLTLIDPSGFYPDEVTDRWRCPGGPMRCSDLGDLFGDGPTPVPRPFPPRVSRETDTSSAPNGPNRSSVAGGRDGFISSGPAVMYGVRLAQSNSELVEFKPELVPPLPESDVLDVIFEADSEPLSVALSDLIRSLFKYETYERLSVLGDVRVQLESLLDAYQDPVLTDDLSKNISTVIDAINDITEGDPNAADILATLGTTMLPKFGEIRVMQSRAGNDYFHVRYSCEEPRCTHK